MRGPQLTENLDDAGSRPGSFSRRNYYEALELYLAERAAARLHDGRTGPREEEAA